MKKRSVKLLVYLTGILILTVYLIYFNGYRWSVADLTRDLDHSIHFSPSSIVYQQDQGSRTIVVSQHENWLECRLLNRVLPFLWKDDSLALPPVDLDQAMNDKTYSDVLGEIVQSCSGLANETLIFEDTYKILDHHRTLFLEAQHSIGLVLEQENRSTIVLRNKKVIDQVFTNDQLSIHFQWTISGVPGSMSIHWLKDATTEERVKALELISSSSLSGWRFSPKTTQDALDLMASELTWDIEDGSVRISSTNGDVTIIYKN